MWGGYIAGKSTASKCGSGDHQTVCATTPTPNLAGDSLKGTINREISWKGFYFFLSNLGHALTVSNFLHLRSLFISDKS
jgi:hypothetical protein